MDAQHRAEFGRVAREIGRWLVVVTHCGRGAQTDRTWRPSYCPQLAQAVCGSLASPQARLGQVTSVGAVVFHWARRDRVLLREVFRFGTATSYS